MKIDLETNKKAVSPVIGVILMVAITVIVAALIGVYVTDLAGQPDNPAQLGVSIDQNSDGSTVNVTLNSLQKGDAIHIRSPQGVCKDVWTAQSDVGSTVDIGNDGSNDGDCDGNSLSSDDKITIIGEYESKNSTVRTYTVD